ncbi:class I SAM-dependent methyltransferase [SAR92 clade bacterium H921]|nr:class I SAM-dependent methyltransferase [SAR92 clade bacterium H921]
MNYTRKLCAEIQQIHRETLDVEFDMQCDLEVANLCALLASQHGNHRLLEIGTGTGLSTLFIAAAKPTNSILDTVDNSHAFSEIAQRVIKGDESINFLVEDGADFLIRAESNYYDFIFADAWPGKYSHLDHALRVLKRGGIYIVDDLMPQNNWPENHQRRVDALLELLEKTEHFAVNYMKWGSGVAIVTKLDTNSCIESELRQDPNYQHFFSS